MMTHRERFRAALRGEVADHIPVVCRLDLWHRVHTRAGDLPPGTARRSLDAWQLELGMGVSARKGNVFQARWRDPVRYDQRRDGLQVIERWELEGRALERVSAYEPGWEAVGFLPRIMRYPIRSADDYALFERIIEHREFVPDHADFAAYDRAIGADGLPLVILGAAPAHELMVHWTGYEAAFYQMADDPAPFDDAVAAGERAFRRMWPIVAQSPCTFVMHGVNFDCNLTPPPIFRRYLHPYLREFNDLMHAAGKRTACHGDGDLTGLLDLIPDAGFDVVDCLACAPLVRLSLAEHIAAWRDRVVIWGGIPSPMLEPTTSDAAFASHLAMVRDAVGDGRGFIAGISDQAMPAAMPERIAALGKAFTLPAPPR